MIIKTVRSSWWEEYGYRLDCQPYLAGALETRLILEGLELRKDQLQAVTKGGLGGIINPGRIKRLWVESAQFGIPFLSGTDILKADLSSLPLIAGQVADENPRLIIHKDWILITRSGSIGRLAYARSEMDGLACTEDVLRVIPDVDRIASGYLFAYLSSKFGIPLVVSGTYGAIIQHIEPEHIADLPVPRLNLQLEQHIHSLVEQAASLRSEASNMLEDSRESLLKFFGRPPTLDPSRRLSVSVRSQQVTEMKRLDAWFFNSTAIDIDDWVSHHRAGFQLLGDVADVFGTSPFKRVYVDDSQYGIGFFGSADIFKIDRIADKFLSKTLTKSLEQYIFQKGMVLLASSGSLGGLIGRPQFVDSALDGQAGSNHIVRIVPDQKQIKPGYLFSFLSTLQIGYPLLLRTATGDAIPEVWPVYLKAVKILKAPDLLMADVDSNVEKAFEKRVRATELEVAARNELETTLEGLVK